MNAPLPEPDNHQSARLPGGVIPRHYRIEMAPDLDEGSFGGVVEIDVEITEAVPAIVCNAAELTIHRALLTRGGHQSNSGAVGDNSAKATPEDEQQASTIRLDATLHEQDERLVLTAGSEVFEPGPARLRIEFDGVLNDRLCGFYRSSFTDDDGTSHTIAVTQFEATDARRAFPCWDEPALKATFEISLVIDDGLLAVSNCAEVGREPAGVGHPHNKVRVSFATTMVMSTYLVAFVVGPLEATEPVDVNGVPVRVIHRPGRGHQTAFALETAAHGLVWLADYYGMDYPSDKVDLVAIPDFAFGAMENLGCVTFREVLLLIDPETANQAELQRVADVINHELAHMWFGDLVTMAWWEGIWLNEAFATFMEISCTHAYKPDWRVWSTFGHVCAHAFAVDALATTRPIEHEVITPADAEDMFDVLTYEKGAAVLRMLEQYLGPETFREGVRAYLRTHAYANTSTSDLWAALEQVSQQPVRAVMERWIHQGGHPLVSATPTAHGVRITQRHFTWNPDRADQRTWSVPVRLRTRAGGTEIETRVIVDSAARTLTLQADEVVTANVAGTGFYRTAPEPETLARIARNGAHAWSRWPDERRGVVDDAWALVVSGRLGVAQFLDFAAGGFRAERDLNVWQSLGVALNHLHRLVAPADAPALNALILAATSAAAEELTLTPQPGESDRTRELRGVLIRLRGATAAHPQLVSECRGLLDHHEPAVAAAALAVTAAHGGAAEFRVVRERYETAVDTQSEQRHLAALADFGDPVLVGSILESTLDGGVRTQDGPYLVRRALANPEPSVGEAVWGFVTGRWEEIDRHFPSNSISRMLAGITALDRPELAQQVAAFLADHPVPQGAKQIAQHLERLEVNTALRRRATGALAEALSGELR